MADRFRSGLLLVAAIAGTVHAADEDFFDLPPEHLSQLKVTAASAFTETALDSSASVSVVNRAEWEKRGARTLPDAVMHLPGVMLLQPPAGGKLIQVRSYDSTSLRGRATLVDDVPINTFAFGSEVFSNAEIQLPVMDSLELVRGPSSILYGSDAFHSALLLSTYRSHLPELSISGELGSDDYATAAVRSSTQVGDNHTLQTALSATHQGNQQFEYEYAQIGGGFSTAERAGNYDAGTGLVRWEGSQEQLQYHLQLFVDKTDANEYPGGGTLTGDTRNHDIADHNSELWMVKGEVGSEFAQNWRWQLDGYYWENDYGQSYYLPTSAAATNFFQDTQQFLEFRYGSRARLTRTDWEFLNGSTQLALTGGVERAGVDDHDNERSLLNGTPLPTPPADYEGLDQRIDSLSLEGKTRWSDGRYQLLYGGRYDDYSTFGEEYSPRIGGIWVPTPDLSFRVQYGTAFRAPNANELRGTNFASGDEALQPETLESYELAMAWSRGSWQVELVGFDNTWDDRILLVQNPSAPLLRSYTNIGESESNGVELSVNYHLERWTVAFSSSYIENENRTTQVESSVFPNWIASFAVGYRWPQQRIELFWSNRLHESVTVGDQALSRVELDETGTFFRSDLVLRKQWDARWESRVTVRNLFDRDNVWPSIVNSRGGIEDIGQQFSIEMLYRALP